MMLAGILAVLLAGWGAGQVPDDMGHGRASIIFYFLSLIMFLGLTAIIGSVIITSQGPP